MSYIKKYLIIFIIIFLVLLNLISTPYFLIIPGQSIDLSQNITVKNGEKDAKGCFLLTSTALVKANLLFYIYSFFDTNINLKAKREQLPGNINQKEYMEIMKKLIQESQMVAKIVALRKAGYYPEISGEGIVVSKILKNSLLKGKLLPGDIITKINDMPIYTVEELSEIIKKFTLNQFIRIEFLRNNHLYSTSTNLIELPTDSGLGEKLGIGVYTTTKELQCKSPLKIEINMGKIKGPSAGLMIALEIMNQLSQNDLTNGLIIAGTGNLKIDGKITEVDGIKQKIISAKKQKADIFLVPQKNYPEALKYSRNIKIIAVEDFNDAIMKLIKL
jgi:PDZ domain-containing protein